MKTGIIVAHLGVKVWVEFEDHERRMVRVARKSGHVVGDRVEVIDERLKRLERQNQLLRHTKFGDQIIAANLDAVGIVVSCVPKVTTDFIDRVIIAATLQHIKPIIIVNKCDLPDSDLLIADMTRIYGTVIDVFTVSARQHEGLKELQSALARVGRSVLLGVSGAGKSSLMNALNPTALLPTSDEITANEHGKHTTSVSNLLRLPLGGELIDTPGVRDFEPVNVSASEIAHCFVGFETALQSPCKFRDCLHTKEPGCSVREAVARGEIKAERYEQYISLVTPA